MPEPEITNLEAILEGFDRLATLFSDSEIREFMEIPSLNIEGLTDLMEMEDNGISDEALANPNLRLFTFDEWMNRKNENPKEPEPINDLLNDRNCKGCDSKALKVDKIDSIAFRFYCTDCGQVDTGIRQHPSPNLHEEDFPDPF